MENFLIYFPSVASKGIPHWFGWGRQIASFTRPQVLDKSAFFILFLSLNNGFVLRPHFLSPYFSCSQSVKVTV